MNCADCLCGQVFQTSNPVAFDTANPPPGMRLRTCVREGFATATAFSILYDKQRLGVYNIYFRRPQALSEQEIQLLETLGQHLGVAIENQRLKSREKELAVSEERNLLAQELHDSIAQGLAFLNIQVQLLQDSLRKGRAEEAMQTAGQLREGVQESYDDVRELLVHFRTRVHQSDLDSAIHAALEKFEGQTGIKTAFERRGSAVPMAPTDEIQIMHIVQESLSNIRKHAKAGHVRVLVDQDMVNSRISVEDDGVGFDPQTDPNCQSDRHVGLKIMRERAHRIGAELRITSDTGEGHLRHHDPCQEKTGRLSEMSEKIRVLLVDDHTLFRSGIKSLLQRNDDFEVVGEAGDGLEGIKRVRSLKPDVALLDLHMPGVSGLEAVKVISEEMPEVNVLMLTVSEDAQDLMDALRAGASGYLLKNIETDTLIEAIRKAAQGESVVSQQMTAKLIQGVRNPPKQEAAAVERDRFSPRERDILASLAQGESNKEIARKLDLAESTVKIHVQNIFKKLNMSSRVQVALYAVENGYGR